MSELISILSANVVATAVAHRARLVPRQTGEAGSGVRALGSGEDLLCQHQRLSRIIYRPRLKPTEKTLPEKQFTGSGNNARLNITDFDVVYR